MRLFAPLSDGEFAERDPVVGVASFARDDPLDDQVGAVDCDPLPVLERYLRSVRRRLRRPSWQYVLHAVHVWPARHTANRRRYMNRLSRPNRRAEESGGGQPQGERGRPPATERQFHARRRVSLSAPPRSCSRSP
jgi:ATP-dependent helicase YprA (DUF1998 family)